MKQLLSNQQLYMIYVHPLSAKPNVNDRWVKDGEIQVFENTL